MAGESSYVERAPTPALAAFAWSVWIQQVGDRPLAQRHEPHGGAEVRCVLGEAPRLLGPLTASTYQEIPAGGTVIGVRLRPGVLGGLAGLPADELLDQDVAGSDIWRDLARVEDVLGDAATPRTALDELQSFVAHRAGELDPMVEEAVRHLMPWQGDGPATLPALLSLSERQLRRRCRAAVGVGPKELHRILRLQGFVARVRASIDRPGAPDVALARWAVEAGYHDQAHLGRECRRLLDRMRGRRLARKLARVTVTAGGGAAFTGGAGADGAYVRGLGCSRSICGGLHDRQRGRGDRHVAVVAQDRGDRGLGQVVARAGRGDL